MESNGRDSEALFPADDVANQIQGFQEIDDLLGLFAKFDQLFMAATVAVLDCSWHSLLQSG